MFVCVVCSILAIKAIDEKLAELAKAPQANFSDTELPADEEISRYEAQLNATGPQTSVATTTNNNDTTHTNTQ